MKIKQYDPQFNQQVINLVLHIQNDESGLALSLEDQPDLADINGTFLENGGSFWIAVECGEVIGTIALKRIANNGGVLKKFFVDERHRGEKIGWRLYTTLLQFCKENDIQQIVLDTPSVAVRSHEFYRRAGFVQIKKEELPFVYEYPDRHSLLFLKKI
ncbi:MAG: GNAT family N-acetyltransferase [Oscillospiraceae bacterium]|nr:GNAT family N-acetyltransferase [Oscillospiraceae bacterium]